MKQLIVLGLISLAIGILVGLCADIAKDTTYEMPRAIFHPTDSGMYFIYRNHARSKTTWVYGPVPVYDTITESDPAQILTNQP